MTDELECLTDGYHHCPFCHKNYNCNDKNCPLQKNSSCNPCYEKGFIEN